MTADILATALDVHAAGLSPLPIRADGTKAPALPHWRELMTQPADIDAIISWYAAHPDWGLGVACGYGHLEMLEFEGRAMDRLNDAQDAIRAAGIDAVWNSIWEGWSEQSPSGGIHLMYRLADAEVPGNMKIARAADGLVLVETRGAGGQTVIAPSAGTVHPTGLPYRLLTGGPATAATITMAQRRTIHQTIAALLDETPQRDHPSQDGTPAPRFDPAKATAPDARPGDRYETTDWADILTPHGWQKLFTSGRTTYWRRPGKTEGISATTGHADDRDRLYVFSTSTEFDTERPYTKFGAYALLEHGGDYSAAGKALAAAQRGPDLPGVGTPPPMPKLAPAVQPVGQLTTGAIQPREPADQTQQAAESVTDEQDDEPSASWLPIDLQPYTDGTFTPEEPTLLTRTDGQNLLYPGLVHDFHGESESGKSLIIQAQAARMIADGEPVLYIDFESSPQAVAGRLIDLGAPPANIVGCCTYVRPEASPYAMVEHDAWNQLLANDYSLAVLDGVTDALVQFGAASKDNDLIVAWHRMVPRAIAKNTGAAVVLVDHVAKDTETRGRYALGGQAKMNALDGASYSIQVTKPLGKGLRGEIEMRIGKDRPGGIRPHCGTWDAKDRTQQAAIVTIDSTGENQHIDVTFGEPDTIVGDGATAAQQTADDMFRPTGVMEKISRLLEVARQKLPKAATIRAYRQDGGVAKQSVIYTAINLLIDEGYVEDETGPRGAIMLRSLRKYRQSTDPESDAFTPMLEQTADDAIARLANHIHQPDTKEQQ